MTSREAAARARITSARPSSGPARSPRGLALPLVAASLLLGACNAVPVTAPGFDGGLAGDGAADGGAATAPGVVRFALEARVAPGQEAYRCQYVRMPRVAGEVFVSGGGYRLSPGTHHYLLYRTGLETLPEGAADGSVDCFENQGVMATARAYVAGGQLPEDDADFPTGVALPFRSGEILLLQGHHLNPGREEMTATVEVELRTVAAEQVENRAGVLRYYDPFIYVGPRSPASAGMRCPVSRDITILGAGAHMHRRGVSYQAFLDPAGIVANTPFYESTDWQHPETFVGYLEVKAGSSIRFQCNYENTDDRSYVQGLSAEDNEMCMFSAVYYPAMDEAEENCTGQDRHGRGRATCAETTTCLQGCAVDERPRIGEGRIDVGECWQKCIAESCPNVTAVLFPQLRCVEESCLAECSTAGEACTRCVLDRCLPGAAACNALACDI